MEQVTKKKILGFCCVVVLILQVGLINSVKADFDNDSKADIFTVTSAGNLLWREASLSNARELDGWLSVDATGDNVSVTVGDFDGDGLMDVMSAMNGAGYNKITWREATGNDNSLNWNSNIQSSNPYKWIQMGDFDSDGNMDLFVNQGGTVRWFEYDSSATAKYVSYGPKAYSIVGGMCVGDFDGWGGNDLLVAKDSQISWYEATGDNTYTSIQTFNDIYAGDMVLGDFDGDKEPDFLVVVRQDNPATGLSEGDILLYESRIPPNVEDWRLDGRGLIADANSVDIELADIDGDGRNELISANKDGGYRYYVASSSNRSSFVVTEVDGSQYDPQALAIAIAGTDFQVKLPCNPVTSKSDLDGDCDSDLDDLLIMTDQWLYIR